MIGVNFDISERRRAEDQRQLLMSEMQHRLRNLLTVVNAVVQLSDRSENVELYREALLARLNAIQGTQRLLLDAPSGAPTLSDLLVPELAPYSNKDASNIVLEGPLVAIPTVLGIPLGLAVHELATNAAKYGALSVPSGKLEVSWAVSAQENGQKLSPVAGARRSTGPAASQTQFRNDIAPTDLGPHGGRIGRFGLCTRGAAVLDRAAASQPARRKWHARYDAQL